MRLRASRLGAIGQGSGGRAAMSFTWAVDADGNWSTLANWASSRYYPDSFSDTANFLSAITANRIVTVDVPVKLANLNIGDDNNYTIAGAQVLSLDGSTPTITITSTGTPTISCPISLISALSIINTPNATISGIISGSVGFTKSGAGNLTISGVNTFSGTVSLNAGQLILGNTSALNSGVNLVFANTSGVVLDLSTFNNTAGSLSGGGATGGSISLGAQTLTSDTTSNTTYSGIISGTGGVLTKTGSGILSLAGANTFTGGVTCNGGGIGPASSSATSWAGTGTITMANGTVLSLGSGTMTMTNNNLYNFTGTVEIRRTGANTYTAGSGSITQNGATTVNVSFAGSTFLTTGNLAGGSGADLYKTGAGNWTIGGTASRTGDFYILEGSVNTTVGAATSTSAGGIFLGDTSGSNAATFNIVTAATSRNITVQAGSSGQKTLSRNTGNPQLTGVVTLNDDLYIQTGGGTMTLNGTITGSGGIRSVTSGGSIALSAPTKTGWTGSLMADSGSSAITLSSGATGASGTAAIVTQSSYTGTILINSAFTGTGACTIGGGSLGGTSSIGGAVTVNSGRTIFGGSGASNAGTLTVSGGLTLNSGALVAVNIGSVTTVSVIAVTGNITFNSNAVTFQATALNAGTYTLFTFSGSVSGTLAPPTLTGTGRTFTNYTYTGGLVQIILS